MLIWLIINSVFIVCVGVMGLDIEVDGGQDACNVYGYTSVHAKFGDEDHQLCLRLESIATTYLASKRSALFLDPDLDGNPGELRKDFTLGEVTMAYGFPVTAPQSGSAEGYIGEDHQFYGVLHLGNRTLHADPYGTDDPKRSFGAFEDDNMVAPLRPRRDQAQFPGAFGKVAFPYHIEKNRRPKNTARARICDLLLLADKEFYEKDANSSLNHVVRRMMHAVAQADIIFRNADFNEDGVPDNIGFSVKYILVLTSNETTARVFGDLLGERTVDGRSFLMRFARLRRLSEVCLGVAFSGHAFHNRTLGLSFTSLGGGLGGAAGGLCDRRAYGRSFNTLALAHATGEDTARVPERVAALTLAHEMGHSFGAHHDDNFPNPECRGYLMGSQSSTANSPMHFEFSLCSKRLIAATLSSMSYCLLEEDRPFCGNGIVEEGESCDCGMPSRCANRDPCCTPRAGGALFYEEGTLHKEGCEVAPSAMCHPSQGPCCGANCQHANLTQDGIRGKLFDARMCGVCCLIQGILESRCVDAETAAREMNYTVPQTWLDEDYRGPNLTFYLCEDCNMTMVRAWPVDSWCVSQNMVGICTIRGICKAGRGTPRSNVYPDIMHVKLMAKKRSSDRPRITMLPLFLVLYLLK
ncbi:disintegrin and metalloproteinase domain-containing protein 17 homolog isoform X2 [Choristoneura fumiferana]|uniref:disintegrin and metalloproteinase domain-containing protein 17 homolog isoform X2 n=1 Tax=Choristoneura fumiferana TaxID=7141 RepID=UPI003D15A40B